MGKTTYSRNPSTSKGKHASIQSPEAQDVISESITKILMRLPKPSRDSPSPKLNNILRTYLPTEDVFLTLSTTEESVELDKQPSSEKHLEDGQKNQSKLFLDSSTILNPMQMLRISRI